MSEMAEELESSTSPDSQDVNEPSSSSDVEQTMEDAILSVVGSPVEDEDFSEQEYDPSNEAPDPSPESVEQTGELNDEPPVAEADEGEAFIQMMRDNEVPLGKIERFQELIHERKQLRTENSELIGVRDNLSNIEAHAKQAGLSQDQIVNWFSMPVMLATEPEKAQQLLAEFMSDMSKRTGHTLNSDLQQKVDDGYMDEESARELSKSRADLERQQRQAEAEAEQRRVNESAHQQQNIVNAVNAFQQSVQSSDPDYSPEKHEFVKRELTALVAAGGMPESTEEAVALAKAAHQNVSERLSAFKPTPRPTRTLSGRGNNRPAAANPGSMFEAISGALGNVSED